MADTEQLFACITKRLGVRYTALWLSQRGFEKARTIPQVDLDGKIMLYTTDEFSIRNNNCNVPDNQQRQSEWIRISGQHNIAVESAYVMTAFGCNFQGEVKLSAVLDQFKFALDACAGSKVVAADKCLPE